MMEGGMVGGNYDGMDSETFRSWPGRLFRGMGALLTLAM